MTSAPPTPGDRLREFGRFLEIQNLGLNLSFALAFLLAAANGIPSAWTFALVVVAFVAARNAGHSFNRWADRRLDALNPRTQGRALVTGRYSSTFALLVTSVSGAVLFVAAYLLNPLAFALAPVALLLLFGYSYSKRFTAGTTVYLGVVEAITPAAAYIAVTGTLPSAALAAVAGVLLWGTAFETIHSLGDLETDRALGLRSLPVALGVRASARLVPALHAGALVLFGVYGLMARLTPSLYVALVGMGAVAAVIDFRLAVRPTETRFAFRAHFLLGAIFLVGVVIALFVPGARS